MPAWVAAPLAAVSLGLGLWINRRVFGFLPDDLPRGNRKGHARPTSLAGVLLAPVVLPWLLGHGLLPAAAAAIALAIGLYDDLHKERDSDLGWRPKAVALLVAAACLGVHIALQKALPLWEIAAVVALTFAIINATNFLDNTDGVTAALAAVGLLLHSGGQGPLAAAGFAALGFLPFNWPRPTAFLGDSGAFLLGVCLATAAVEGWPDPRQTAAPVVLPLCDFTQVVLARILLGFAPWIGDRRHITHMLTHLGLPTVLVAPLLAALAALTYVGLMRW